MAMQSHELPTNAGPSTVVDLRVWVPHEYVGGEWVPVDSTAAPVSRNGSNLRADEKRLTTEPVTVALSVFEPGSAEVNPDSLVEVPSAVDEDVARRLTGEPITKASQNGLTDGTVSSEAFEQDFLRRTRKAAHKQNGYHHTDKELDKRRRKKHVEETIYEGEGAEGPDVKPSVLPGRVYTFGEGDPAQMSVRHRAPRREGWREWHQSKRFTFFGRPAHPMLKRT